MSGRALLLLFIAILLCLFTILNWQAFTTPTTLWLLFTRVQAPLGLILLVIIGLLAAVFLLYVVYLQSTMLLETRRTARELNAQRQLAQDQEASRITELRGALDAGLRRLDQKISQTQTELAATIEQTGTVLTSYIGEVEDRLERRMAP